MVTYCAGGTASTSTLAKHPNRRTPLPRPMLGCPPVGVRSYLTLTPAPPPRRVVQRRGPRNGMTFNMARTGPGAPLLIRFGMRLPEGYRP